MRFKKYVYKIIFFLFLFSLPVGSSFLYLYNSYEFFSLDKLIKRQLAVEGLSIVGMATNNQGYHYKLQLTKEIKPDILIIGSSRVLEFRDYFFNTSVLNAGSAMTSIHQGYAFVREVLKEYKPKLIIIGVDYWWFNENAIKPNQEIKPPPFICNTSSFETYVLPLVWLYQKKIKLNDYVQKNNPLYLRTAKTNHFGVNGLLNNTGYNKDGSYYYTRDVMCLENCLDERFASSIQKIARGDLRYEHGVEANDSHFASFRNMLREIKSFGIPFILLLPPNAPTVMRHMQMQKKDYGYIDDLKEKLKLNNLAFFDFLTSNPVGFTDCEFIDGVHGGDLVYAKMVKYMAEHSKEFNKYANIALLDDLTKKYHDISMIPNINIRQSPESDFLKLGCDKSSQYNMFG